MKSANTSTSDGNTFAVAGRRTSENIFWLNGVEYTGSSQLGITPGGVSGELLGIDAIREFNVLTDSYGAEYGKRAGAQVSVVTASGTNALHGSLFEFLRNSDLDARNFFDQGLDSALPPQPVRRRARRPAEEGQAVPVRQLRRFPPGSGFEQRRRSPRCRGAARFAAKLAAGWRISGIAALVSGFPFTPLIGSNRSGDGDTRNPDRPSLNPNFSGPVILGNPNQWFNPNAFVLPPPGTYGNLGRGTFTGPGLADLDLSASKTTPHNRARPPRISRRVLQYPEPHRLRHAERHGVFQQRNQSLGGPDHSHDYHFPPDSIWNEADFLTSRPLRSSRHRLARQIDVQRRSLTGTRSLSPHRASARHGLGDGAN